MRSLRRSERFALEMLSVRSLCGGYVVGIRSLRQNFITTEKCGYSFRKAFQRRVFPHFHGRPEKTGRTEGVPLPSQPPPGSASCCRLDWRERRGKEKFT